MTKLIPILSGRCLVVELTEGVPIPDVINTGQPHLSWLDIDIDLPDINLPPGNWQIVGMLPEITEGQASSLVFRAITGRYRNYTHVDFKGKGLGTGILNALALNNKETALESLESAIVAEGYIFQSPEYPDINDPQFYDDPYDGTGFYQELYSGELVDWKEAQSRVLSRERCLLLRRADG